MQAELVRWTQRRSQELGLRLTAEQALYVSAATGNDLAALDDQLAVLRAGGAQSLRTRVAWTAGGTPWNVADQILEGDLPRALSGVEALFRGGFQDKQGKRLLDPTALAMLLLGALQRGASGALDLVRPGGRGPQGSPQMRAAAEERARRRSANGWRGLLEDAGELERALKTGSALDANDFARLALRWSLAPAARRTAEGRR